MSASDTDVLDPVDTRLARRRSERAHVTADRERAAEALARATANGAPDGERKKLRAELARLESQERELAAAVALLDREAGPERQATREMLIREAESAAVAATTHYADLVREAESLLLAWLRGSFSPAYDGIQLSLARAREAHAEAVRTAGDRPQDRALDERPEMRALPMERAQTFFYLAPQLARLGGSHRVPDVNQ